jgi:hypothetical protein
MKPIIERKREGNKETVNFNLALPIAVWCLGWLALAAIFKSTALIYVAAIPAMFILGLWALGMMLWLVALLAMGVAYMKGEPITRIDKHGNEKTLWRLKK